MIENLTIDSVVYNKKHATILWIFFFIQTTTKEGKTINELVYVNLMDGLRIWVRVFLWLNIYGHN